jgi:hypothetical protein
VEKSHVLQTHFEEREGVGKLWGMKKCDTYPYLMCLSKEVYMYSVYTCRFLSQSVVA